MMWGGCTEGGPGPLGFFLSDLRGTGQMGKEAAPRSVFSSLN